MILAGIMLHCSVLILTAFVWTCKIVHESQLVVDEIKQLNEWLEIGEVFIDQWGADDIDDDFLTKIKNS
jgi:hypothetical protein